MAKVTIEKYEDEGQEFKVGDIVEYEFPGRPPVILLITDLYVDDLAELFEGFSFQGWCRGEVFNGERKRLTRKFRGKIIIEQE